MEYFNYIKGKTHHDHLGKTEAPVLSEEDEAFLHRIASEGTPPPLPERPQDFSVAGETSGNDAQIALMNGAQNIPLPDVPDTPDGILAPVEDEIDGKRKEKETVKQKRPFRWSFLRRDSRDNKRKNKEVTATDLMSAAESLKPPDAKLNEDGIVSDHEAKKEEEEMTEVLDHLNLAAVNNRVFSISKESQDLLHKLVQSSLERSNPLSNFYMNRFTLVFKDLVNGVPTAYDDLESLLTNSENQIQRTYAHLPSFLQDIIEKLPSKMTTSIGPEMLAAAAEKQGLHSKHTDKAASAAEKMGLKVRVPSLKDLVTKPGAVAGMLRAVMNFLKIRFPAFLGMNVLYSLALFSEFCPLFYLFFLVSPPLPSSISSPYPFTFPSSANSANPPFPLIFLYSSPFCILVLPQTRTRSTVGKRASPHRSRNGRSQKQKPFPTRDHDRACRCPDQRSRSRDASRGRRTRRSGTLCGRGIASEGVGTGGGGENEEGGSEEGGSEKRGRARARARGEGMSVNSLVSRFFLFLFLLFLFFFVFFFLLFFFFFLDKVDRSIPPSLTPLPPLPPTPFPFYAYSFHSLLPLQN